MKKENIRICRTGNQEEATKRNRNKWKRKASLFRIGNLEEGTRTERSKKKKALNDINTNVCLKVFAQYTIFLLLCWQTSNLQSLIMTYTQHMVSSFLYPTL